MPKIQNIGVGNFIRNPRGTGSTSGGLKTREVMQIVTNNGNSFTCYPVTDAKSVPVTLDTTRYIQIPVDTDVEQASI